jgi:hypothetical protein
VQNNNFVGKIYLLLNPLFLYLEINKPQGVFLVSHLSGYKVKLIFKQHRNPSPLKTPGGKKKMTVNHASITLCANCVHVLCV